MGGKGGRCVGMTALTRSSVDLLEILGASDSRHPKACPGLNRLWFVQIWHHLLLGLLSSEG